MPLLLMTLIISPTPGTAPLLPNRLPAVTDAAKDDASYLSKGVPDVNSYADP
jgi:hypothetical protein